MTTTTRKDALEEGATRYFTGEPCKNGHVSERYTLNSGCVQCLLERRDREKAAYKAGKEAAGV